MSVVLTPVFDAKTIVLFKLRLGLPFGGPPDMANVQFFVVFRNRQAGWLFFWPITTLRLFSLFSVVFFPAEEYQPCRWAASI